MRILFSVVATVIIVMATMTMAQTIQKNLGWGIQGADVGQGQLKGSGTGGVAPPAGCTGAIDLDFSTGCPFPMLGGL